MIQRRRMKAAYKVAAIASESLQLNLRRDCSDHPVTPFNFVERYRRWLKLHRIAKARGYQSVNRIELRMLQTLDAINEEARRCREALANTDAIVMPCLILPELLALFDEFEDVEFIAKKKLIRCTTDPIELSDVQLGRFDIELDLRYIGQSNAYRVVARDANPATTCDSTTHPHVQSERLCEGEATAPIRNALRSGRLCDFFVIVRQTLQTYNRDSAYISLDDWDGVECHDCGSNVDESEVYRCEECEHSLCCGCSIGCERCSDSHCDGCIEPCEGCEDRVCAACLSSCERCDEKFCSHCLEEDLCDDCTEQKEEEAAADTTVQAAPTNAAIHADGVGEVAVPA